MARLDAVIVDIGCVAVGSSELSCQRAHRGPGEQPGSLFINDRRWRYEYTFDDVLGNSETIPAAFLPQGSLKSTRLGLCQAAAHEYPEVPTT